MLCQCQGYGLPVGGAVAKPIPPRLREPAVPSVFHGPKLGVEFASGWQAKNRGRKQHPAPFSHDLGTKFAVQLRPVQNTPVAGNHPLRFGR